ncbi:MAG: enolase C-terminal domain-like protein [Devosia sp.]
MKIKSIRAFAITNPIAGGTYEEAKQKGTARRPPWTKDAEVANPMSRYPRYKALRASWNAKFPAVGVIVTSDDGSWGFGTTGYGQPTISLINDHIGPLLEGENALATEKLYDMMMRIVSPYSASGLASYAISGIDLALWDLKGRVLKLPVYELAGGAARDKQFCYATGNDTDWHMELGFKATKLACPYGTADGLEALDRNEEFVGRARELIGPKVELMLDCWMAFDVEFAVRLAQRLRPFNLKWIEDCLIPEDHTSHKALRERLPWQTIATGEHWYTPYTFFEAAKDRVADIFQPDIHWVGGFTACQKIATIAEYAGLEVFCHAGMNTPYGQHFTIASTASKWGEFFVGGAPGQPLKETNNYPGMAVPVDGYVVVSDEPGFGHGLSMDAIEKMAI